MNKTAVILCNIGSPDSPEIGDVKKYLKEFLMDKDIISIPYILRYILVNFIIVPFRASKSAKHYASIKTEDSFPLILHSNNLLNKIRNKLSEEFDVFLFMRYGNPSIEGIIGELKKNNYEKIIFMPLFPQYATSTTGSAVKYLFDKLKQARISTPVYYEDYFFNKKEFIRLHSNIIRQYKPQDFDLLLFSFHGLPLSHLEKIHNGKKCDELDCKNIRNNKNELCYVAQCYEMSRIIMSDLSEVNTPYNVSFQSRMSNNWTKPFTKELLIEYARKGIKKILIVCPSFVADCLETVYEINSEYNKEFIENGGETLTLVESVNDKEEWAVFICEMVYSKSS